MATPLQYYQSLPPVAKTYAVICLMTTGAYELHLYRLSTIALFYGQIFRHFQVWRLLTNFLFIGSFSFTFAFRLYIIVKYGVSLERGPFDKRTADYVWMFFFGALSLLVMTAIPYLRSAFMGPSLVFMIVYIWGREFPNERINFHNLVEFKGFYLPWTMVAVDMILGNPVKPDLLGIAAGHIYYFLSVLYPLAGGKDYCKTPRWVHKLVARWGKGFQFNTPVRTDPSAGVSFQGRSYRLGGNSGPTSTPEQTTSGMNTSAGQTTTTAGGSRGAFSGRSYRLDRS